MIPNRIVIDTNVLLDLFVFRDPRWALLHQALERGEVQAWTRADCSKEWQIVLGYSHLPLDDDSRQQALQQASSLLHQWEGEPDSAALPVCRDRDDQKFLELARDVAASVLITKDKALLKLARQMKKRASFSIMTPQAWVEAWQAAACQTSSQ